MLPDVAAEAALVIRCDPILKAVRSTIPELTRPTLTRWANATDPKIDPASITKIEALAAALERTYLADAFQAVERFAVMEPQHLFALEAVCGCLVSELRYRGWSDKALAKRLAELKLANGHALREAMERAFPSRQESHKCFVAVTLGSRETEDAFRQHVKQPLIRQLPQALFDRTIPKRGPFVEIEVYAYDPQAAAEQAYSQVAGTIGALAIFKPQNVEVRSKVVGVAAGSQIVGVDVTPPQPVETRETTSMEVGRILASSNPEKVFEHDAVFDAIRHRTRALETQDPESRFILLWFALERLVLGAPGYGTALAAARSLIPKSIAIGKLRNEVAGLAAATTALLDYNEWKLIHPLIGWRSLEQRRVDHVKLCALLQAPKKESQQFTAVLYDRDVRLVQWYERLRRCLYGSKPKHVAQFFEDSRQRIEWQVLRLYRARNSVAHAGQGPSWLRDLTTHASYYVTQLIAIVVHYRHRAPSRSPAELLASRAGQYDAFLDLVKMGDAAALQPRHLLKPTLLVGQ